MNDKKIGEFLTILRKAKGLKQKDLAEMLNVSDKTVSRWECGDGYPDLSLISEIAAIFDVTVDELIKGEKEKEPGKTDIKKTEKQVTAIVARHRRSYISKTTFSIALAVLGLLIFLMCSLFEYGFIAGLCIAGCCFVFGILMQFNFAFNALEGVSCDEFSQNSTEKFRHTVYFSFTGVLSLYVFLLILVSPLIVLCVEQLFSSEIYEPFIYIQTFLETVFKLSTSPVYAAPYLLIGFTVCAGIFCLVSFVVSRKNTFSKDYRKAQKRNTKLRFTALIIAAACLISGPFIANAVLNEINERYSASKIHFDTFSELKEFAEQDVGSEYNSMALNWKYTYNFYSTEYECVVRNKEIYEIVPNENSYNMSFDVYLQPSVVEKTIVTDIFDVIYRLCLTAGIILPFVVCFIKRSKFPWENKK